jgi:anionic cell wall polymer biosynthesis LytR-Cps2A-Psr (LCP) family protein
VNNPHASASQGFVFDVGTIDISGEEALAYVRERKQLPRGDLDRAERQRLVAQAVLEKSLSKEILLQPAKFNGFVSGLARQVKVDAGLTVANAKDRDIDANATRQH